MQIKAVFKQNRFSFPVWPLQNFISSTVAGQKEKIKSHSQVAWKGKGMKFKKKKKKENQT